MSDDGIIKEVIAVARNRSWPVPNMRDGDGSLYLSAERWAELQDALEELLVAEQELRKEWWLHHGHDYHALYGDDGELACNACPADFKRQSLDELRKVVFSARMQRASELVGPEDDTHISLSRDKGDLSGETSGRVAASGPASIVRIARCPEHGLHGERQDCFVCGKPVEQATMIEVSRDDVGLLIDGVASMVDATHREAAPLLNRLQRAYGELKGGPR